MTHEEIKADLPLYALGSLEPAEQQEIARHLAGCDECRRELQSWIEVVGMVPLEAPDASPPDLKQQLLDRVRTGTSAPPSTVARRRIGWAAPLAAAALALLAINVYRDLGWRAERGRQAGVVAGLQREIAAARGDLAKISAALAEREADADSLRAALANAHESLSILSNRGLTVVALKETKDAPPAEGHILLSPPSGRAIFYAFDLPQVPSNKTYELWWITEKEGPVQAGIFRPDEHGIGRIETTVPSDAGAIQAAAVTVEDSPGVPKPQGPMVLIGALSKS